MHYIIVENIRSNWREFQAIHELDVNVPLLNEIFASNRMLQMASTPDYNDSSTVEQIFEEEGKSLIHSYDDIQDDKLIKQENIPIQFVKYLKEKFNPSQYYAIQMAATQQGFTLVQGPPGTGKTTTIIGMLNTVHLREFNKYYLELLKVFTVQPEGLHMRQQVLINLKMKEQLILQLIGKYSKSKPRILIVAPSNIAVDNIIIRIMENSFRDGNNQSYKPDIVRVGGGRTSLVESVSLEHLLEKEIHSKLSFTEKQRMLEGLNITISTLIREIFDIQAVLIQLITGFNACYPLPYGWEVRVTPDDAHHIYWVNHIEKTTSREPPVDLRTRLLREQQENGFSDVNGANRQPTRFSYYHVEELPEFIINSHRFTIILSDLDSKSLKRQRLLEIVNIQSIRGKDIIPNAIRDLLETSLIEGAQLLFTTLNSCGHPSMESSEFCVTVIDEAAQSVEPSTLIALRKGCRQCIMVGDQRQLPATIFSDIVCKYNYNRSLFERLIESGHPYVMLNTQYRMTPEIARFPSEQFYYNKLTNGSNVEKEDYLPLFIRPNRVIIVEREETAADEKEEAIRKNDGKTEDDCYSPNDPPSRIKKVERPNDYSLFYPLMFFDLQSSKDIASTSSRFNKEEIKLCIQLLKVLYSEVERIYQSQYSEQYQEILSILNNPLISSQEKRKAEHTLNDKINEMIGSIGIITPYSEQLNELQKEFFAQGLTRRKPHSGGTNDGEEGQQQQRKKPNKYARLNIELNTVDGFQGKEKDFIIMTTVRANDEKKIGFLSDIRRLNVAITRSRYGLFIVGSGDTLSSNRYWRYLLKYARETKAVVTVPNNNLSIKKLLIAHQQKHSDNYPKPTASSSSSSSYSAKVVAIEEGEVLNGNEIKQIPMKKERDMMIYPPVIDEGTLTPPPPPPPASPKPYELYPSNTHYSEDGLIYETEIPFDQYVAYPVGRPGSANLLPEVCYDAEKRKLEMDNVYSSLEFHQNSTNDDIYHFQPVDPVNDSTHMNYNYYKRNNVNNLSNFNDVVSSYNGNFNEGVFQNENTRSNFEQITHQQQYQRQPYPTDAVHNLASYDANGSLPFIQSTQEQNPEVGFGYNNTYEEPYEGYEGYEGIEGGAEYQGDSSHQQLTNSSVSAPAIRSQTPNGSHIVHQNYRNRNNSGRGGRNNRNSGRHNFSNNNYHNPVINHDPGYQLGQKRKADEISLPYNDASLGLDSTRSCNFHPVNHGFQQNKSRVDNSSSRPLVDAPRKSSSFQSTIRNYHNRSNDVRPSSNSAYGDNPAVKKESSDTEDGEIYEF
jgi:superfamily I DNA and/or RNA helicase